MASDTAQTLKRCYTGVATSSRKERKHLFATVLTSCFQHEDISDGHLKAVAKIIGITLHRYHDRPSQYAVEQTLSKLMELKGIAAAKALLPEIIKMSEGMPRSGESPPLASVALVLLKWTTIILEKSSHKEISELPNYTDFLESQWLLVSRICSPREKKLTNKAYRLLRRIWRKNPKMLEESMERIAKSETHQLQSLCFLGLSVQYLVDEKEINKLDSLKNRLLDKYLKIIVTSKIMPPLYAMEGAIPFLKYISHDEFKSLVLPAIEKALLRNPEVVIEAVGCLISGVSIDLSQYAEDVGKCLSPYIHSTNETVRAHGVKGFENLSKQCSDPGAVEKLIVHLFAVLNGSEGKLSVAEQRLSVVTALSVIHSSSVSGKESMEKLATEFLNKMRRFLEQEAHEGILVEALKGLKLWSKHFVTGVPSSFVDMLKKGLSAKVSTPQVKSMYFQVATAAFSGNTLHQAVPLIDLLLQHFEKVKSQSHQPAIVTEALTAATLLAHIATLDDAAQVSKIQSFWNSVLDSNKLLFTSEKYLTSSAELGLQQLLSFMDVLFASHSDRLTLSNARPWYKALVIILLHPSWTLRSQALTLLKAIMNSSQESVPGTQLKLLTEYREVLNQQLNSEDETSGSTPNQERNLERVSSKLLLDSLNAIVLTNKDELGNVAQDLCFDILIDCHHPILVKKDPNTWVNIMAHLGIEGKTFVKGIKEKFLTQLEDLEKLDQAHLSALETIVCLSPEDTLPHIITKAVEVLNNPGLVQVTNEEYGIMTTPEGELYDKTILESAQKAADNAKNVKRESKAYSYKEQKLDMELREELKKKKGEKPTEVKPQFTKKQQEMLEEQRLREKGIRDRLKAVEAKAIKFTSMLSVAVKASPNSMAKYVPNLTKILLHLMHSPLAAPYAVPLFIQLKDSVFHGELKHLGNLIAHVTVRLHNPACEIDPEWCTESITEATKRSVEALHTFTTTRNVAILMTYTHKRPFPAPTFGYCLPLLRVVFRERGSFLKGDEKIRQDALQLILAHSKLRSRLSGEAVKDDHNGPALLPRVAMISVLSEIIVEAEGHNKEAKLQQSAAACLIEVCKSGSGDLGCAIVEPEVIVSLLDNVLSMSPVLRRCSLEALHTLKNVFPKKDTETWGLLVQRILLAKFDVEEDIGEIAARLWEEADLEIRPGVCYNLLEDVIIPLESVRVASSYALAAALDENTIMASDIKDQLIKLYEEKSKIPPPVLDSLGRVVSAPFSDVWESRAGIALALEKIAQYIPVDEVESLFTFYVQDAFGDRNEIVRKHMLDAAIAGINEHGKECMSDLLKIFENFMDIAPDSSAHDTIRQSVVILLGSLAKHLEKTDPKIKPIFSKLIDALSTPSQQVQEAVASCLPPLCSVMKDEAPALIKKLLDKLLNAEKYGERRGAAYGLAGIVKGLGILALKQQNIIATLTESIQDKKNFKHREGALFAFETLCGMLGRLFEPYVVHLLPHLLLCFGDGNQYVREAADETAKAVMRNLSAHGVKLVLPSLLKALDEDSWRTKTGSVELLGAMAFCAPKQLSSCLPNVVPRLIDVLADSHMKVQKAGQQALRQIGGVIRNPEILEIAPIILDALTDPANKTVPCLQALLSTSFVHFIDAPSLALIMPCLERAMGQRSTETKKMSAQILGNMYALTDQKDLAPYLPAVIPGLKKSLLDPSPEVRGVSARALGAMVRGMGEDSFDDLLPWLLETLTSENSSVDRSGAAQGLAEVLHGLGSHRLEELMPDVIETTSKVELAPHVREGYLMLYIYLPTTFGETFMKYIGDIIPPILKGLADETEYVRDTSLKAGQRIISTYSETAVSLFLPQLEEGLFDENWRIRYSSVQLLGDLLFRVSGVSGKMTTVGDEDDNFGTAHSTQAIMETLGEDRRNRVLAGLYMGRSDISLMVRQASLHVWKVVVQNTARTLREILPTLFSLLLGCLASTSYDKRQVAARTLGDLVRKLGERVLPEIIPILEKGLDSERDDERQGVCIGLTEIMSSTNRDMVIMFEDSLISTVRRALLDPLPEVREAAANTFDQLHDTIGGKALDGILPHVLKKMEDEEYAERALDGLRNVMSVKSRVVLPFLVPKLTSPPVNTKALAILSAVAGEALTRHLGRIIPAMFDAIDQTFGSDQEQESIDGTKTLILSVEDDNGVTTIVDELLSAAKHKSKAIRKGSAILLCTFCGSTKVDYSQFVPRLLQGIFNLMNDSENIVYGEAWKALDAIIKHLDPSEQMQHIGSLRKAIRYVSDDVRNGTLPGFCIPRQGITPLLPVYREGILNGSPELKEQAAELLGDAIKLTSPEALKPSVLNVTGPLIRILGDRFGWNVKVAIISTLALLLEKVGITLKPFLPQLQTTFIKALNDKTLAVRQKAAYALKLLTALHTRVDSLFTEIRNGIKNNEDSGIRETILQALRAIILTAGSKMGEAVRKNLLETLTGLLGSAEDGVRVGAGGALGALCSVLSEFEVKELLDEQLLDINQSLDWTVKHGRTVALSYALFDTPEKLREISNDDSLVKVVLQQACADRIPICMYGVHSLGHLMMFNAKNNQLTPKNIAESMKKALQHTSNEVRVVALQTLRYVGKKTPSALEGTCLKLILPDLVLNTREKNTGVKAAAESTICSVLRLRDGDSKFQDSLGLLSSDTSSHLQELRRSVFNKLLQAPEDSEQYPFDPTQELK